MAVDGVSIQIAVAIESSLAEATSAPTPSSIVPFERFTCRPTRELTENLEYQPHHDRIGFIRGKLGGTFEFVAQLRTGDGANASIHAVLISHALGRSPVVETTDGNTTVTWTPNTITQAPFSLVFIVQGGDASNYSMQVPKGAIIERLSFVQASGTPTLIEGSGRFTDYGFLGGRIITVGTAAIGAVGVTVNTGHSVNIRPSSTGIPVALGSNNNGGAGYRIDSVNQTTEVLSITPGVAGSDVLADTPVMPIFVTDTIAGSYPQPTSNTLTLSRPGFTERTCDFISMRLDIDTGFVLLEDEADLELASRMAQRQRKVSGTVAIYLDDNETFMVPSSLESEEWTMVLKFGADSSGSFTFTFDSVIIRNVESIAFEVETKAVEVQFDFEAYSTGIAPVEVPTPDDTPPTPDPFLNEFSYALTPGAGTQSLEIPHVAAMVASYGTSSVAGTGYSVFLWVRGSFPAGQAIINKWRWFEGSNDDAQWSLETHPTLANGLRLLLADTFNSAGGNIYTTAGGVLNPSGWNHVGFTWRSSADPSGGNVTIWVNGVAAATSSSAPAFLLNGDDRINTLIPSAPIRIGYLEDFPSTGRQWTGSYDEIVHFSRWLDASEVGEIYNSGSPSDLALHSQAASRLGWYRCGDSVGDGLASGDVSIYSLSLTGATDQYVQVPDRPGRTLGNSSTFSVFCWVYRSTGATGEQLIVGKWDNNRTQHTGWLMELANVDNRDLTITFAASESDLIGRSLTTDPVLLNTEEWYHVGFTFDGGTVVVYVNGVVAPYTLDGSAFASTVQESNAPIQFGHWAGEPVERPLTGLVDDCTIWSSALNAAQVVELYNSGTPNDANSHSQSANLLAYYTFGDTTNDWTHASTLGQTGALQSSAGGNNGIAITTTSDDDAVDVLSANVWMWIDDLAVREGIMGRGRRASGAGGWNVGLDWNNGNVGSLWVEYAVTGSDMGSSTYAEFTLSGSNNHIRPRTWQMITLVFDLTETGLDRIKVYVDTQEMAISSIFGTLPSDFSTMNNGDIRVGNRNGFYNDGSRSNDAWFRNFSYYLRALSTAEIATMFNNGAGGAAVATPQLELTLNGVTTESQQGRTTTLTGTASVTNQPTGTGLPFDPNSVEINDSSGNGNHGHTIGLSQASNRSTNVPGDPNITAVDVVNGYNGQYAGTTVPTASNITTDVP